MFEKQWKEVKTKIWPKTKKELEKGMKETRKLLDKGEVYLKEVSEKSARNAKKMSLTLQKEKMFYEMGKTMAKLPRADWTSSKKISDLLNSCGKIDRQVRVLSKPQSKKKTSKRKKTKA